MMETLPITTMDTLVRLGVVRVACVSYVGYVSVMLIGDRRGIVAGATVLALSPWPP